MHYSDFETFYSFRRSRAKVQKRKCTILEKYEKFIIFPFLFFSEALLGKEHKEQQVNYDVKIGDGMDIAIHGENGNFSTFSRP